MQDQKSSAGIRGVSAGESEMITWCGHIRGHIQFPFAALQCRSAHTCFWNLFQRYAGKEAAAGQQGRQKSNCREAERQAGQEGSCREAVRQADRKEAAGRQGRRSRDEVI